MRWRSLLPEMQRCPSVLEGDEYGDDPSEIVSKRELKGVCQRDSELQTGTEHQSGGTCGIR